MRRQIIIYPGSNGSVTTRSDNVSDSAMDGVSWIVQEPGSHDAPVFHGDMQTAANHAMGCRVVLLLPPETVLLTQAALPNMNRQRLVKAIPFALEEALAGDVDDLHFAPGTRNDDTHIACAIVECEQMDSWLAQLKGVNVQPDVITSATYAIPFEDHEWTLLISDTTQQDGAVLRTGKQSGLLVDYNNILPLLRCFLENTDTDERPDKLRVIVSEKVSPGVISNDTFVSEAGISETGASETRSAETITDEVLASDTLVNNVDNSIDNGGARQNSDHQNEQTTTDAGSQSSQNTSPSLDETITQLGQLCSETDVTLNVQQVDDELLAVMAHSFDEQNCINLLQGRYSRKEQFEKLIRPWRAAAAILFAWFLLQTGFLVSEYQALASKDIELRSEIVAVFKDAFPKEKNILDPKRQMEKGLEKLQGGGTTRNDMITLLATTGEIIKDTSGMSVRGIRYKSETLNIDIEIADLQALDTLKIRLIKEAGLDVEIVSASSRSGKVESRLKIRST